MKMTSRSLALSLSAALLASPALAATHECGSKINKIFAGDEGHIWLYFQSGISARINPTDPDQKNILTLATSALLADKPVIVRYDTTLGSAVCNPASGADYGYIPVVGLFLSAN